MHVDDLPHAVMSTATPEFDLLAAACRWPPSRERRQAIRTAVENVLDWSLFAKLVQRHRVAGLVHAALADAGISEPQETIELLRNRASNVSHRNLLLAAETIRIQRLLDARGIPNLTLKGVPLGVSVYNSLALKQAWDIDILLEPDNVCRSVEALLAEGYDFLENERDLGDSLGKLIDSTKECILFNSSRGTHVEIHWRLCDNPSFLSEIGISGGCKEVEVSSVRIKTLRDADLFTYLCVHGAAHGWSRLKWLADLNAFISSRTRTELKNFYEVAASYGAGHAVVTAQMLCDEIFNSNISGKLVDDVVKSYRVRILLHASRASIKNRSLHDGELSQKVVFFNRISQVFLSSRPGFFQAEMSRIYKGVGDQINFGSKRLKALYPIIRIYLVLARILKKSWKMR